MVLPSEWDDKKEKVVRNSKSASLNAKTAEVKSVVEMFLTHFRITGQLQEMTASELRRAMVKSYDFERLEVRSGLDPKEATLKKAFLNFIETKTGKTKRVYKHTLNVIGDFYEKTGGNLDSLSLDAVNVSWLERYNLYLEERGCRCNTRSVHMRNIRSVMNRAIADGLTLNYPFRAFKIKTEKTRKRSLSLDDLRKLLNYPAEEYAVIYRDMFALIFMLMGINTKDIHALKEITPEGRIEYRRAKTGRLYSLKVEPEAMAIIEKYRGESGLLSIADRWQTSEMFMAQMNKALQRLGAPRAGRGGRKITDKAAFPGVSSYWARHTWATIAASLDIPKETIAAALGHGGNTVTDIYIDFDRGKIDRANRAVLDWVLYGRRTPWWCDYDAPYAMPAGVPSAQPAPYGHGGAYYSQEGATQQDAVEEAAPAAPVARRRGRPRKAVGAGDVDCKSVGADTPKSVDGVPGAPAVARLHKSCRVAPVVDVDCALDDNGDAVGRGRVAACGGGRCTFRGCRDCRGQARQEHRPCACRRQGLWQGGRQVFQMFSLLMCRLMCRG